MASKPSTARASKTDSLTVAVLSDLHACEGTTNGRQPSILRLSDPEKNAEAHPITGLRELITRQQLKADLLLCAGDLGDRAFANGIKYAWAKTHEVAKWLGARDVVGTTGNHDVDSRFTSNTYDAREFLKSLEPKFPIRKVSLYNQYWAQHYAIVRKIGYRLVLLNSCAYHGGPETERDHGRVSEETLRSIRKELEADQSDSLINILLCHHHPQQHQELHLGDYDVMKNGQLLLDLLGSGQFGHWLVVHGHKHHPKLCYASGGATSAVIFSAGSLSVDIQHELQGKSRNQFYILRMPLQKAGSCLVGTIDAWDWSSGVGWIPAGPSSGLPSRAGFGCRDAPLHLAARVQGIIGRKPLMLWAKITEVIPELDYVLPMDINILKATLRHQHQIELVIRDDGLPYQIGRRAT